MKYKIKLLAFFLAAIMILGSFITACTSGTENDSENGDSNQVTESGDANVESESATDAESESESLTQAESESETEEVVKLEGKHAELIENAYSLANGVNAYFESSKHKSFIFENQEMTLSYGKDNEKPQLVESLQNKKGNAYVSNTMDVFVRMTDRKSVV